MRHSGPTKRRRVSLSSPVRQWRARGFPLRAPSVPGEMELPEAPPLTGVHFPTDWARQWPARIGRAAIVEGPMRAAVWLFAAPLRQGTERLDAINGPLIFAANHHSHLDTLLLLTSIPEPWRHKIAVGAAADYFFSTRLTGAVSALAIGAIPVERNRVGRRSADMTAGLLEQGWSLLIFPEGSRSPDGWGQPFRGGVAYLARRCGVPVAPVHMGGTGRILRKGSVLPQPATATVTFGNPISPADGERAIQFTARIEAAVAALADETATDWYSARRRAYADESPSLTGPEPSDWRRAWAHSTGRNRKSASRNGTWPTF